MGKTASVLSVAAFVLTATAASSDVIISNLSSGSSSSTLFGSGSTTQFKAFGFTMPGQAYFLDNATLTMNFPNQGSNPVVSIWSDIGGQLGAELLVLDNPGSLSGQMDFAFTPGAQFTLEANTSYWLHVRSDPVDGPSFNWIAATEMPSGIATAIGYNFNGNPSSFFNRLEINGTPVPAPGALALLGVGALIARRRRRS